MAGLLRMMGLKGPRRAAEAPPAKFAGSGAGGPKTPGDGELDEVMARFESPLLRYVGQLLGRYEEAQDVVQEVFLRYCRHSDQESVENLSSWLFCVAHNLAQDALRQRGRERKLQREFSSAPAPAAADGDGEGDAVDRIVRRAASERALAELGRLPEELRQVLLLKIIQDMPLREIARVTGLSFGVVAYRTNQGLKELGRRLKEAGVM